MSTIASAAYDMFQSYLSGIESLISYNRAKREIMFQSYLSGIERELLHDFTRAVTGSNRTLVELKEI